jgi:hypothetical protein
MDGYNLNDLKVKAKRRSVTLRANASGTI